MNGFVDVNEEYRKLVTFVVANNVLLCAVIIESYFVLNGLDLFTVFPQVFLMMMYYAGFGLCNFRFVLTSHAIHRRYVALNEVFE